MPNTLDIWIAGSLAATTVDLLIYPLDTLKTRLQSPAYKSLYTTSTGINRPVLFRGLYQGVGSVVIATVPSSGAFFTTYESVKYLLTSYTGSSIDSTNNKAKNALINSVSSSTAELVSCAILTPAEVIKQNAQMVDTSPSPSPSTSSTSSSSSSTKSTVSTIESKTNPNPTIQVITKFKQTPLNLFNGYTALVARNLPFTAIHFPIFEAVRESLSSFMSSEKRVEGHSGSGSILERSAVTGVSAGFAGCVASIVTMPVDVVKTRVMLSAEDQGGKVWEVGRAILKQDGVRGLFRGGLVRAGWTAVGMGVYLGIYEWGRAYLEKRH
ncbi:mitochondrial carrier domain-containing protein [Aspergillus avenaceus]|uniref:Mitochondrial carrier domain-containing protein n=1 Tax=Aspergillus avenaceus TaxID=36643 RepID=A0A5N6U112_ASPAV|nr:mitochondrial carrier domain-containing protein [Aspergillus avenaceus]